MLESEYQTKSAHLGRAYVPTGKFWLVQCFSVMLDPLNLVASAMTALGFADELASVCAYRNGTATLFASVGRHVQGAMLRALRDVTKLRRAPVFTRRGVAVEGKLAQPRRLSSGR